MKRNSFVSKKPPTVTDPNIYIGDYVRVSEDFLKKNGWDQDKYGVGIVEEAVQNHMWKKDYRCYKVRWLGMDKESAKVFMSEIWPVIHLVKESEGEGIVTLMIMKQEAEAVARLLKVVHRANEIEGLTTDQVNALRRVYLKEFNKYA